MPYERQLKVRQVYKILFLGVEQTKSQDVNLKFSQNSPVTPSIGDVFKGSNNRTVQCAYASPVSNGLLEKLIHFTEKARKVKGAF